MTDMTKFQRAFTASGRNQRDNIKRSKNRRRNKIAKASRRKNRS